MKPGPTIIKKCSECSGLIAEPTMSSENTFGAKYWTDGKIEAPMLPENPWLVKCHLCDSFLWLDEQQIVKELDPEKPAKILNTANWYKCLEFDDYIKAFDQLDRITAADIKLRSYANLIRTMALNKISHVSEIVCE